MQTEQEKVLGLLYCHQSLKGNTTNINCENSGFCYVRLLNQSVQRKKHTFSQAPARKHAGPLHTPHSYVLCILALSETHRVLY